MQDGVGVDHVYVDNVGKLFAAMQKRLLLPDQKPNFGRIWRLLKPDYSTASNSRIVEQIRAKQQYVSKITTFAVLHYQMPEY